MYLTTLFLLPLLASTSLSAPLNTTEIEPREILQNKQSDLMLTTYTGAECTGNWVTWTTVYTADVPSDPFQSYKLSRTLQPGEQLDFDQPLRDGNGVDHPCGWYFVSAPPLLEPGCRPLGEWATFFRLWHH
ncbi:hypothetical protein MMC17_004639 [Xylographa soralifera]|nr:hypothetical protein [Xylographa soralifera]